MNPVSILIFNSLAMREAVSLAGVGTLMVTFVGAAKEGSGRIVPPHNCIEFLKDIYRGRDLVEMISLSSGKNIEASEKIYRKWLDESTADGVLAIEGVGTIFNKRFTPDKMIARVVNPAGVGTGSVRLKKRDSGIKVFVICAALIAAAALSFAAVAFWDAPQGRWLREKAESILENKPLSEVGKDTGMPVEESAADPFGGSPQEPAIDAGEESALEPAADPGMHSQQPSQQPEQSQPAEVSGPFYYVIIGNFSTDGNAERFIVQCKARDNSFNYGKLTLDNGKVMVYTSRSSSPTEARDLRKLESYPEAWVFKYRK